MHLTEEQQDRRRQLIDLAERNNKGDWLLRAKSKQIGVVVPEVTGGRRGQTHTHFHHRRHPGQHHDHSAAA